MPKLCHTKPTSSFSDIIITTLFPASCLLVWSPGWNVGTQLGNKQMHTRNAHNKIINVKRINTNSTVPHEFFNIAKEVVDNFFCNRLAH